MTHRSDNRSQRRAVAHPSASLPGLEMTSPDAELVRLRENLLGGFGQAPNRCKPMEPAGGHSPRPPFEQVLQSVADRPDTPSLPPTPPVAAAAPRWPLAHTGRCPPQRLLTALLVRPDPTMTCAMMNRRTHP